MSRTFTDENLLNWEAFASGGKHGLPGHAEVVFHCLTDPRQRARAVVLPGGNAMAEQTVHRLGVDELRELLRRAEPLD